MLFEENEKTSFLIEGACQASRGVRGQQPWSSLGSGWFRSAAVAVLLAVLAPVDTKTRELNCLKIWMGLSLRGRAWLCWQGEAMSQQQGLHWGSARGPPCFDLGSGCPCPVFSQVSTKGRVFPLSLQRCQIPWEHGEGWSKGFQRQPRGRPHRLLLQPSNSSE